MWGARLPADAPRRRAAFRHIETLSPGQAERSGCAGLEWPTAAPPHSRRPRAPTRRGSWSASCNPRERSSHTSLSGFSGGLTGPATVSLQCILSGLLFIETFGDEFRYELMTEFVITPSVEPGESDRKKGDWWPVSWSMRSEKPSTRQDANFIARPASLVYYRCMSRTNIDIDETACAEVMRRYQLSTKRDAVNYALRALAAEPASLEEARAMRGSGWEGDLEAMRSGRLP